MGYNNTVAAESNLFTTGKNFLSAEVNGATMSAGTLSENNTYVVTATVDFSGVTTQTVKITYTLTFTTPADYQTYFYSIFEKNKGADTDVAFTFDATLAGGGN